EPGARAVPRRPPRAGRGRGGPGRQSLRARIVREQPPGQGRPGQGVYGTRPPPPAEPGQLHPREPRASRRGGGRTPARARRDYPAGEMWKLPTWARVTIGTPAQNAHVVAALASVLEK